MTKRMPNFGYSAYGVSDSLKDRHPYLPHHSEDCAKDSVTTACQHRGWERLGEQLRGYPDNGIAPQTINDVLGLVAVECKEPGV